jgi:hypothetical protein
LKNLRPEQLKAMQSLQSLVVDASRVQEFERTLNRRGLVIRSSYELTKTKKPSFPTAQRRAQQLY